MTAIISQTLRQKLAADLFKSYNDSPQSFYIALGKSEQWSALDDIAPNPIGSNYEERRLRESLQSMMVVGGVSYVVPRTTWTLNTIYSGYDDDYASNPENNFYVYSADELAVYLCLRQAKTVTGGSLPSTIAPSGSSKLAFKTSDGYVWKYLCSITAGENSKYVTAAYIPIRRTADGTVAPTELAQRSVQDSAIAGQICGFQVVSGGSGYTTAPTLQIIGDGIIAAQAVPYVNAGSVTHVNIFDSLGTTPKMGAGYTKASVKVTGGGGGTGAVIRPIFAANPKGFGHDARIDLRATALMFNAKPVGNQGGDFIVDQDFRQVSIIKNPRKASSLQDSAFTDPTGRFLKVLTKPGLGAFNASYSPDHIITGSPSGANAIIDFKSDSNFMYVHQNMATGFGTFLPGDALTTNLAGSGNILDSEKSGEVHLYKGTIYTIDNRNAIYRTGGQTEDLKPIIQF